MTALNQLKAFPALTAQAANPLIAPMGWIGLDIMRVNNYDPFPSEDVSKDKIDEETVQL